MHDYSIIGSYSGFYRGQLPLERIPSFTRDNSIRVKEVDDLKHEDETDIEFMESLYRNSNSDYYLGGWIVKAVVDILLEFTIGDLPTIQSNDKNYETFCNQFWNMNQSGIYAILRELGLFGQEFCYIGWDYERQMPKLRAMSKKQIMDIRYENFNDPTDITFVRFRDQFFQAKQISNPDELGDADVEYEKVFYDKFFWKELNPKYKEEMTDPGFKRKTQPQWIYKMKIYKKVENQNWEVFKDETLNPMKLIPIVEFNQNKLSFDSVGYSDLSGAMKIIQIYHQVLESTINNSLYNSQPTLKFTGLDSDPLDFVKRMYGDYTLQSGDIIQDQGLYDVYGAYYLSGGQDVSWLTVPTTAQPSKEILNILFYILVQVTGVPEWALGAGMEGAAYATVRQQSIPLLQKVRSKRMDITDSLLKMNRYAYMIASYYTSNIADESKKVKDVKDYTSQILWADVMDDDINTKLEIIEFMLSNHFITKETAVSIIGLVDDPTGELKRAQKQYEKENKNNDNTGTIQKLINKQIEESKLSEEEQSETNIQSETEETKPNESNSNEEEEETSGEMVSKVARRIFELIYAEEAS